MANNRILASLVFKISDEEYSLDKGKDFSTLEVVLLKLQLMRGS